MKMAGRIGIFVCGCRGAVSDVAEPEKIVEGLARVKKSVAVKVAHDCLCSPEGRELIRETAKKNDVDCLLIAACPAHFHEEDFKEAASGAGLPPEMVLRLDIRESCAYAHRDNPEAAGIKAINLVKMYNARAKLMEPHQTVLAGMPGEALVVGAGMAGLTAAYELALSGINVTVVEKEFRPGGRVVQLHKLFPRMCDAECGVAFLLNRLYETGRFILLTGTEVTSLTGSAGRLEAGLLSRPRYVDPVRCNACGWCSEACPVRVADESNFGLNKRKAVSPPLPFDPVPAYAIDRAACPAGCDRCVSACPHGAISLDAEPQSRTFRCGVAILATGWRPYEVERVERLGYGRVAHVVTSMQMERLMAGDFPEEGLFARPSGGRPLETVAFVQCAGSRDVNHQRWCSAVCCTASLKQALIIKEANPETEVYIFYTDIRTPGEYEELYRMAQERGVVFVRSSPAEVRSAPDGNPVVCGEDTLLGKYYEVKSDLVVLAMGIKPNEAPFPVIEFIGAEQMAGYGLLGAGGFIPGHQQCFPYESKHSSIFFAGTMQEPLDIAGTVRSATGAAGKAARLLGGKVEVLPQVPEIIRSGCDKCKRCVEECPFGVMRLDEEGYPVPELAYCRACQLCLGACPRNCIVTQGFDTRQMVAMVTAKVKEVAPGEPFVVAFMCENDAYRALLDAASKGLAVPPNIHPIPVRCLGSVNMLVVQDAIPKGVDGFVFAGCRSGECHYVRGADRAAERIENLLVTMKDMMIEPERVKLLRLGIGDGEIFAREMKAFVKELKSMGTNPFKAGQVNLT
jgi:heterodisulfide reductase subunit A-like polyferredoxin/coenzyme F420-reducing hydrogenase delta subunit